MKRKEYMEKWADKCMHCEHLQLIENNLSRSDDLVRFACIWSEGGDWFYGHTAKQAIGSMLLDERNIWRGCEEYTERLMELYSVNENESDGLEIIRTERHIRKDDGTDGKKWRDFFWSPPKKEL